MINSRKSNTWIYPYANGSKSVQGLKNALGAKEIKREESKFRPTKYRTLINWGASDLPEKFTKGLKVLNNPQLITLCSNKRDFFAKFQGAPYLIESTTDFNTAFEWVKSGKTAVCRTKLTGHSGEGIVIFTPQDLIEKKEFPKAPLYTQYKKKKHEFRLHVVNGEIIDEQRKVLRTDDDRPEKPDFHIRTHNNGFIFARNDSSLKDEGMMNSVRECVLDCFSDTGLDFGAIDVIYNSNEKKAYILEINTAPGLTGTTLDNYVNAFQKMGL